jgi:hypothetical protein
MHAVMEASWSGVLGLSFEISTWKSVDVRRRALSVSISGQYKGPEASEGGVLIGMIVAAAMANPWGPCNGLVLNLRDLDYRGGDMLFYWRDSLHQFKLPDDNYPCALVCSEANVQHVRSLLEDEGRSELLQSVFLSLDDTLAHILSK